MRALTHTLLLLGVVELATPADAASVYQEGNHLVISDRGEIRRIELPPDMKGAEAFTLQVRPETTTALTPSSGGGSGSGSGRNSGAEDPAPPQAQPKLGSLLVQANKLFQKKKFEEAMTVLDTAENIDPQNAQVKAMKGSLFYLMGWTKFARQYWEESLGIEPNQPKVRAFLSKTGTTP